MIKAIVAATAITISLSGCASLDQIPATKLASGTLHTASGVLAGTVVLMTRGDNVIINVTGLGLPQGLHGLHLHMVGSCDTPDFKSAGGHLNPHGMQHGIANPAGSHLGDLPNLAVDSFGAGTVTATLRDSRIAAEAALFDADGTAIVVHAQPDDDKTDPSGNSGARIACGVLKRG